MAARHRANSRSSADLLGVAAGPNHVPVLRKGGASASIRPPEQLQGFAAQLGLLEDHLHRQPSSTIEAISFVDGADHFHRKAPKTGNQIELISPPASARLSLSVA